MKNIDFKTLPNNPLDNGIQYHFKSENGYGASIIKTAMSYGGKRGLWEVAVLGLDGEICYNTPITDDVLGYLTEDQVNEILIKIDNL